jgi:DnaJ-class molecular chaperone
MDNYYDILAVSEKASQDEIKQSYRKLSLKYHPDKNPGNVDAIGKFQKISEAYENIGTPEKRREYDNQRKNPFFGGGVGSNEMSMNIDELFSNLFGGPGGGFPGGFFGGDMDGFMGGGPGGPKIHIFHGGMGGPGPGMTFMRGPHGGPIQKPPPVIKNVAINMEQVLLGANIPVDIERWIMENGQKLAERETIYVQIPKGVDDNEIIVLANKGNSMNHSVYGDVKLIIKIENKTDYERNGLDLIIHKNISLKDALCGFSFELKYINNKTYTINNSSGNIIPPDYKKVIPNMGLTRETFTGSLIIIFHVLFPEKLSEEKMALLRDIL